MTVTQTFEPFQTVTFYVTNNLNGKLILLKHVSTRVSEFVAAGTRINVAYRMNRKQL